MTVDHANPSGGPPAQSKASKPRRRANDRRTDHPGATGTDPENARLMEDAAKLKSWRLWGPYLSERGMGYRPVTLTALTGTAWDYLTH